MSQSLRVISWNVNGLRARAEHVERLLQTLQPDVLCMQETKVQNDLFPAQLFDGLGYIHQHIHGQKSHHGVAIVAKTPLNGATKDVYADKDDCRHVGASVNVNGHSVQIHNFYVPSGGDEPDVALNEKFDHKIKFWTDMATQLPGRTETKSLLVGDLNVAPRETDVWDHKRMQKMVGHSPQEVAALDRAMDAGGWVDLLREVTPVSEPLYSWWTYRSKTALERDRGWRLDHAWATPDLRVHLQDCTVYREARTWEKPSDHAPVVIDLAL